jgi:hypothetical protein
LKGNRTIAGSTSRRPDEDVLTGAAATGVIVSGDGAVVDVGSAAGESAAAGELGAEDMFFWWRPLGLHNVGQKVDIYHPSLLMIRSLRRGR